MRPTTAAERRGSNARSVAGGIALVLLISAIVSFAPPQGATLLSWRLHDFGHVLVFTIAGATIASLLLQFRAAAPDLGWLLVAAITSLIGLALGVLTEMLQDAIGGIFSRGDVFRDVLGTAAGIAAAFAWRVRARYRAVAALLLAAALGANVAAGIPLAQASLAYLQRSQSFPVLFDPARPPGLQFTTSRRFRDRIVTLEAPWSTAPAERALAVPLDRGPWPGIALEEPAADWRGWAALEIDVVNPDPTPLTLNLRIDDAHGAEASDRYDRSHTLPPGARTRLVVPLDEIRDGPRDRALNLATIHLVILFHSGPAPGRQFLLRQIRLTR